MRLIARNVLAAYAKAHAETAVSLERWQRLIRAATWTSMDDVRRAAPRVKVLNRERARFEVAERRLQVDRRVRLPPADSVREISLGTHAEYDKVDALTISMF